MVLFNWLLHIAFCSILGILKEEVLISQFFGLRHFKLILGPRLNLDHGRYFQAWSVWPAAVVVALGLSHGIGLGVGSSVGLPAGGGMGPSSDRRYGSRGLPLAVAKDGSRGGEVVLLHLHFRPSHGSTNWGLFKVSKGSMNFPLLSTPSFPVHAEKHLLLPPVYHTSSLRWAGSSCSCPTKAGLPEKLGLGRDSSNNRQISPSLRDPLECFSTSLGSRQRQRTHQPLSLSPTKPNFLYSCSSQPLLEQGRSNWDSGGTRLVSASQIRFTEI